MNKFIRPFLTKHKRTLEESSLFFCIAVVYDEWRVIL